MKIRLLAIAAAAAAFTSCLPVPFDLALSQGAAAAKKMNQDANLLTLNNGTDPSAHDFAFYAAVTPAGFDYTNGFVVSQRDQEVRYDLVQLNGSGKYDSFSQQSRTIANPDPHAPSYLAWPMESGSTYLLSFLFDALDPFGVNSFYASWGDPGTHTITDKNIANFPFYSGMSNEAGFDFGASVAVIGASVSTGDPAGTFDFVHWLGADTGSPGFFGEYRYQLAGAYATGITAPFTPRGVATFDLSAFIPNGLTRLTYFYDDNWTGSPSRMPNRSFASWWAGGTWVCYAWEGPPAVPPTQHMQLPINHRIDALLSNGQLLSTEGGIGRLYDRDGNLLATFPLGNLVYLGEHYVGGAPRCYFSQSVVFDNTQHFNVYWIPTGKLDTLAD